MVRLETHRTTLLQYGLVGSVKTLPKPRDAVVVQSIRGVIWLVVIFLMVPQKVRVKVTVSREVIYCFICLIRR